MIGMDGEDQMSALPQTPRSAIISFLLGILGMLSVLPALYLYYSYRVQIFLPSVEHLYRYFLYWIPWLLIPIGAIISGYQARKAATGQTGNKLSTAGLVLGYLATVVIGSSLCTTVAFVYQVF